MHRCWMCEDIYGPIYDADGLGTLRTFKGYTVDFRLQQFRKVPLDDWPEFIEFESPKGEKLVSAMHAAAARKLGGKDGEDAFVKLPDDLIAAIERKNASQGKRKAA